jgi:predicted transcriptional regulator
LKQFLSGKDRFWVSAVAGFYDVLFEVSNEDRHTILLLLEEEGRSATQLSKALDLSLPEISRHVSRLGEAGLARKDVDGLHRLTPYGELVLSQLRELEFTSRHRGYLATHSTAHLPPDLVRRISDLSGSTYSHSVMEFLHGIDVIVKESEERIWFIVDQYPMSALASIGEALNRGVEFRGIEPSGGVPGPDPSLHGVKEIQGLKRARTTPLVEEKALDSVDVFLFLSEKRCAIAFPTPDGEFDYRGFTATDELSLSWCADLFDQYWEMAVDRVYVTPTEYIQRPPAARMGEQRSETVVVGRNDAESDARAVQDAVDNYGQVRLEGSFNFGTSRVTITKSVVIKGEGREGDIPSTKIYKKGWAFPISEDDYLFRVEGEGVDVTIENIHFTDFNDTCISNRLGNSVRIRGNRITLPTGIGRGYSHGQFGDVVVGISVNGGFPGGVSIEGNHLDFAISRIYGGYLPPKLIEDPAYRPDLRNHEYYIGWGVLVREASGAVTIRDNVIRNLNSMGIAVSENHGSTDVLITGNTIVSEVHGSYYYDRRWAGNGIMVQSAWVHRYPGHNVEIRDNTIRLDKPLFIGVTVAGPDFAPEGSGKLREGVIEGNKIHLENGSVGIMMESSEGFQVTNNTISGKAYFGMGFFPRGDIDQRRLGAYDHMVSDNDMKGLEIKEPDEHSVGLFDEKTYAASKAGSATANVWLGVNTRGNIVQVSDGETVVDEGRENKITSS